MGRLILLLACAVATAPGEVASAAQPLKKAKGDNYALLVGCAGYTPGELRPIKGGETVNDILEFEKALLATGFKPQNVVVMHDRHEDRAHLSEYAKITERLRVFLAKLGPDDTVVLAFSGHGVLFAGEKTGYFCPVDAKLSTRTNLLPLDGPGGVFEQLERCKAGTKLLIVNACRGDPSDAAKLAGARIKLDDDYPEAVPKGIAAIYSCEPKQESYFDKDRKRSVFFVHLTDAWLGQGGPAGRTVEDVFADTCRGVKGDPFLVRNNYAQVPVVRRKYEGQWLVTRSKKAGTEAPLITDPEKELRPKKN